MKKIIWTLIFISAIFQSAYANTVYDDNYEENPNYIQGNKYLSNSQYSSAINEFKKAIRVNPNDTSSLIGLSNAYNMRAVYYNNTVKSTENAISDIKSALFFVKYYPDTNSFASAQSIASMEKNLSTISSAQQNKTAEQIFAQAKASRVKGEFAAAGYDYYQLINNAKYSTQAYDALGDIFKILNRPDKSLTMYKNALKTDTSNTDIHLKLARIYEALNDFPSALKEYSLSLSTSSERADILNSLERIWQKKVDENPSDAEAHANLGVVFQKQKRYTEAMEEYKKAEKLNPSNINTKINIGTLYQEQKKYEYAINTYNSILELQPQNVNVMTYKAQCLKALNRNDEAVSTYKTALNIQPDNASIKAELFELLKNTMPTEDVLSYLYKNVQNSPMNADAYYEFAYELHKANKLDDAITYYQQTIKMDNTKTDAYINLSQAYRQKQMYNQAFETIKKAKNIAPDNQQVIAQYNTIEKEVKANTYNHASDFFQSGDYESAINEYLKINPPTTDSLLGIAASYQSLSDYNNALQYYKKALDTDTNNSEIPFYIASIYANLNDLTNAEKYLNITLSKNPNNQQAKELQKFISDKTSEETLTNAINFYDKQNYTSAITELNKVISKSNDNSTAYYYRALCYDAINKYEQAITDYKLLLKYSPEMTIVYYLTAIDYDNLGNSQKAIENFKKYIDLTSEDNDYKKYAISRTEELQK